MWLSFKLCSPRLFCIDYKKGKGQKHFRVSQGENGTAESLTFLFIAPISPKNQVPYTIVNLKASLIIFYEAQTFL